MHRESIIIEIIKNIGGFLLVALMFAFILGMVLTGGGILDPLFWDIVFYK